MNHYLGVEQITTGGYNPRGNAIVERFMHTLGHMLRIASNDEYNNLKDYLQCIAFAHNCTYSSVIECTPFEAGHGLRARTVAEARMAIPKLQLLEEESGDGSAAQAWDKSLSRKVLELASRMATIAQFHSEWHRRMTSEKLNQANRPFDDSQLQPGMKVYFYKPPSQQEVSAKGQKSKHLAHYHGPATVIAMPRKRQLELEYKGKSFNRDISLADLMLVVGILGNAGITGVASATGRKASAAVGSTRWITRAVAVVACATGMLDELWLAGTATS